MTNSAAAPASASSSRGRAEDPSLAGTILIVEDDASLSWSLEHAMRSRGLTVHAAASGAEALRLASEVEPDIVVLDLGLPDFSGVEVCRQLRRWMSNPIIVLTVDDGENRKVDLLDAGADDYVTKPFSMPELMARVRVALRHRSVLSHLHDPARIEVGALAIDEGAHLALLAGEPLALTRKEFALLTVLARNAGRVMSHAALLEQVWGGDAVDRVEYLRTHVNQLRRKMTEGRGRPVIVTEPGVGYRLLLADNA